MLLIRGKILELEAPVVMGIINVTPDSFYAQSRTTHAAEISRRAEQLLSEGAEILDVGAYSTRPGHSQVTETEEAERLKQACKAVRDASREAIISVDTFRASVARKCVEEFGADIINDVSGGADIDMFATVANLHVPYVLSHIQGTLDTMTENCRYDDLLPDMILQLAGKLQELHLLGVADVIIDPGFGFSKTAEQNLEILSNLDAFKILECPILAGISRKSMLCKTLNITAEEALNATTAAHMVALQNGASILRVHDVKEAMEAIKIHNLTQRLRRQENKITNFRNPDLKF